MPRPALVALLMLGVAFASAADSTAASQVSISTSTWSQIQQSLLSSTLFSKSGDTYSGPLLSAMQTFGSGLEEGLTSLQNAVKSYNASQVQAVEAAFNDQFCDNASYEAPKKKPLNFTGPSASLTFSWGSCTFNESQFLDSSEATKILNCTEPSITYDKEPAIFTSKYTTGGSYSGKSCTISKDFGEESTQVLYVFDDKQSLDVLNVTAVLEQRIASLQDSTSWMPASSDVQSTILALLPGASSSSAASSAAST